MYKVRVSYQPIDEQNQQDTYQKGFLEGIYIPKDGRNLPNINKIKQEVWEYLQPRLKDKKRPSVKCKLIKIEATKLSDDFIVCEDKS